MSNCEMDLISHIKDLVTLQGNLTRAFFETYTDIKDKARFLDAPSRGQLNIDGQVWRFRKHGSGFSFSGPNGEVVDIHTAVEQPQVFDAWRLLQYLESLNKGRLQFLNEKALSDSLEELRHGGSLERVSTKKQYLLSKSGG